MKKNYLSLVVLLGVLLVSGCSRNDGLLAPEEEPLTLKSADLSGKYIVVLNDDNLISATDVKFRKEKVKTKANGLLRKNNIDGIVEEVYGFAIQGFAAKMTPGQARQLALDGDVKIVERDQVVTLSPIQVSAKPGGGGSTTQTKPWGITRVGGGESYTGTAVAWVIDTGVDLAHGDLNVDQSRGVSFVPRVTSPNDDNGHGSHVAGIIAAKNNSVGVVGVAAGAKVIPVKVLDRRGSGAYSTVISGVDYVAQNAGSGDVANMSLGGPVSDALDLAVKNASAKLKFVLAAGNESDDANSHSPARVNGTNIYTISAMNEGDKWASYSNYGNPPVDYCAPGTYIYSTYKAGGYATLSGTSMAAPHVAGLLLLGAVTESGTVTGDPDGKPDVIAHH